MKNAIRSLVLALTVLGVAVPAQAACFADYRAKMDNPLRLHYGVIEIPDALCDVQLAGGEISARIAAQGWELLQVIAVFDETGLETRRADAGEYFLSF